MSVRYSILGSSGVIGSALARRLLDDGNIQLSLIDRIPSNIPSGENIRFELCDLLEVSGLATASQLVTGIDALFFKVGLLGNPSISTDPVHVQDFFDTNLYTLITLLERCGNELPNHILIDSSIAAVGSDRLTSPIVERETFLRPMNFYGLSKLALEDFADLVQRTTLCKVTVFRYPRVHAPGSRNVIWHFICCVLNNQPIVLHGNPEKEIDFVHLDDVIEANVRALRLDSDFEILHVSAGEPVKLIDLANMVISKYSTNSHPIIVNKDTPVPVEPLLNSLDARYSRRVLGMGKPKSLNRMIEETYLEWSQSYEKD